MKNLSMALAAAALSTCLCANAQDAPVFLLGSAVPVSQAQRTITVNPDTRWVNVTQGEVIRFVAGNAEFGWRFDGPGSRSFDLQQIAPGGALSRTVTVYVTGATRNRAF